MFSDAETINTRKFDRDAASPSRRVVKVIGSIFWCLLAVLIISPPHAHADFTRPEQVFIGHMSQRGIFGNPDDQALVTTGHTICRMLENKLPKATVMDAIQGGSMGYAQNHGGTAWDRQQVLLVVNAAWVDLCPSLHVPDM
ncbi:DUF732 domain-containing protein [Mycolicibacter sinensis]